MNSAFSRYCYPKPVEGLLLQLLLPQNSATDSSSKMSKGLFGLLHKIDDYLGQFRAFIFLQKVACSYYSGVRLPLRSRH